MVTDEEVEELAGVMCRVDVGTHRGEAPCEACRVRAQAVLQAGWIPMRRLTEVQTEVEQQYRWAYNVLFELMDPESDLVMQMHEGQEAAEGCSAGGALEAFRAAIADRRAVRES